MTATGLGRGAAAPYKANKRTPNENEAVWVATETGSAYLYPKNVAAVLYEAAKLGTIGADSGPSVQVVLTSGNIVYLHDERSYEELARLLLKENFPEPE